jgi:hypothetical protein
MESRRNAAALNAGIRTVTVGVREGPAPAAAFR